MEEAEELCDATSKQDIAWEAADLIYFALVKCTAAGVSLSDIEKQLDRRSKKVTRRAGDGKPKWDQYVTQKSKTEDIASTSAHVEAETVADIKMKSYSLADLSPPEFGKLLLRPIIDTKEIMSRVEPIMKQVRERGDQALLELTAKFDSVTLEQCVLRAPFDPSLMELKSEVRQAIDQAYANIYKFHDAQLDTEPLIVETMPGVTCSRFVRPIQRVGLYVPGGSAVLPSSTLMLGVPAKVAGCTEIVVATPPRKDGSVAPEVMYVAHKIGASCVLVAGGAQAVAAMAYGTESVPKVDKICGPGNQYVTAAKMIAQVCFPSRISICLI